MNETVIKPIVRHLVSNIAGALIVKGVVISDSQIELITGAATAIAVVAWSILEKRSTKEKSNETPTTSTTPPT